MPFLQLRPRRRARLRGSAGASRWAAERGSPGQPSKARTGDGSRGARRGSASSRRASSNLADHPEVGERAHDPQVRRGTMSDAIRAASAELPIEPPVDGLEARFLADDADYEPLAQLIRDVHAFDGIPWLPTADNLQFTLNHEGIRPP